jgi:hypothetical protein
MNLKEDIHAQNVQLKIANKDLRVKLDSAIIECSSAISLLREYRLQSHILFVVLIVSIFFNLFAYYLLTR